MLTGNYKLLYQQLIRVVDSKRIFHDPLYTLAFGTDASFYRPDSQNGDQGLKMKMTVSLILKESSKLEIPVTFRAAGNKPFRAGYF